MTPRPIKSPLAHFEDLSHGKVKKPGAVPREVQQSAMGLLQRLEHGEWSETWLGPLANDVAPVNIVVSNKGQVATFDNWHDAGYGNTVIVLYDLQGKVLRHLALDEFIPHSYASASRHSVSSIWWGCSDGHHFSADGSQLVVRVYDLSVAAESNENRPCLDVNVDAATGAVNPPAGPAWDKARAAAIQQNRDSWAAQVKNTREFREPLVAPVGPKELQWFLYLQEAFFRIDPDWHEDFPATAVLRAPNASDYLQSLEFLKQHLVDDRKTTTVLMIASISPAQLLKELPPLVHQLPRGSLERARIYLALGPSDFASAKPLFNDCGARLIMLDPQRPIPQRPARLAKYLKGMPSRPDPRDFE